MVNPTAGGGRAGKLAPRVAAQLGADGIDVRTIVGRTADEAGDLAHRAVADGVDALVALGGDGMVSIVLQAVAGTPVPLGIVPSGTGNDVARAVGLPRRDPLRAADAVIAGHVRTVDLGRATTAEARGGSPASWPPGSTAW